VVGYGGQPKHREEIMKSQIETCTIEAIKNNDLSGLFDCLNDAGAEPVWRSHKFDVPGYGTIVYDDVNDPSNPGWVVVDLDGVSHPVDHDELADDLVELLEMLAAV
jgi:hypothetical protein